MVRPHLEYSKMIWDPVYQADIRSVETIQRRATKLIPELKDLTYVDRVMKNLGLPSLMYRRRRGDMIQMYKIMDCIVRIDNAKLFSPAKISSTRGHLVNKYHWASSHAGKLYSTVIVVKKFIDSILINNRHFKIDNGGMFHYNI